MLEVIGWIVFYSVFLFMIIGSSALIFDTVMDWKREKQIQKRWRKATW